MVVQIQRNGRNVTGLHIGSGNVRRYFPKSQLSIDLELGHLLICCKLRPDFWHNEPSISDPRLNLWLEAKEPEDNARQARTQMSLVRLNGESFRLEFESSQPAKGMEPLNAV
jgi:hypothetical protein